ncbi:MAG: hypothetical protein H7Z16_17520 [Pyrinomonadaceae bacterium]|nr:hypothetical protein [Pyrinomonadaceae bacterium]
MKHHPAWLAAGLLVFVVLACSVGKNTNTNSSSGGDANVETGPGIFIKEIHMAKDDGSGKPGDKTSSFEPGDRKIHSVATLKEPKPGTEMKFSWWIVDAGGAKDQKIKDIDYTTGPDEQLIHGHLIYPINWPSGKYKVQVYVNGDLDRTIGYTIE